MKSVGDIDIYKALFIDTEKIDGLEFNKYYFDDILGYLLIWKCKFNTKTQNFHSTTLNHVDIIKTLPDELKNKDIYTIRLDFLDDMPTLMVNPSGLDNDRFKMIGEKLSRKEINLL